MSHTPTVRKPLVRKDAPFTTRSLLMVRIVDDQAKSVSQFSHKIKMKSNVAQSLLFLLLSQCCSSLVHFTNGNYDAYALQWENVLLEEHRETVDELKSRRKNWSRSRLEASGMSIFDAYAEPDTEVFGDKIVRVYKFGETRLRDRFTKGDVLVLTPEVGLGGRDPIPREGLVVDVGKDWISLGVGNSWPLGLW